MAKLKVKGFDTKHLMREIEETIENDLKKHPEKFLDSHVGDKVKSTCSACGETTVEILKNGKAKCTQCGLITKVDLTVTFK